MHVLLYLTEIIQVLIIDLAKTLPELLIQTLLSIVFLQYREGSHMNRTLLLKKRHVRAGRILVTGYLLNDGLFNH